MLYKQGDFGLDSFERGRKWYVRMEKNDGITMTNMVIPADDLMEVVSRWCMDHYGNTKDYWRGYQDAIKEVKELLEKEVG